MRRYIRHPFKTPIEYTLTDGAEGQEQLLDFGAGGLCFQAKMPLQAGCSVHLCLPLPHPPFEATGIVAWCHSRAGGYVIGVKFPKEISHFALRMAEQICHIQQYRLDQLQTKGRKISTEQAANEWIERYAGNFPT